MATKPLKPALRERHDRKRRDVAAAAAAVFAARGYERTTVAQLAEDLGLATGALYHYFPGKEQILIEICGQLTEPLVEAARADSGQDRPPDDRLRDLVRLWVSHVVAHRAHLLVFTQVRHLVDHGDQWREVRQSRKAFEQVLEGALADLADADSSRTRLRLYALLGMVNHTVQWFKPRGPLSAEQIADGYTRLVLGETG